MEQPINGFTVNCLTDYINLIKEENLSEYYFRGESNKYDCITSSLIRCFNSGSILQSITSVGRKLIEDYYREIGNEINEVAKKDFLAFSQHHGIKTNLIDFTTAPLVALYFACKSEVCNGGFVYALKKESTVDATSMLLPYCSSDKAGFNYYSQFEIENSLNTHKSMIENYLHNNCYCCSPQVLLDQFIEKMQLIPTIYCREYIESYRSIRDWKDQKELIKKYKEELSIDFIKNENISPIFDRYSQLYCILLLLYKKDLIAQQMYPPFSEFKKVSIFPPEPYLIYKAPIAFDRIKMQYGVFIYQGIFDFMCEVLPNREGKHCYGCAVQPINPDIEIKIENQEGIAKDLDLIGINEKTLFGDYDTIASYVNRKTFEPIFEKAKIPFHEASK